MIKAIIFDCFGVLVTESWLPFKQQKFAAAPGELERIGDLHRLADTGRIPYEDFISEAAVSAGVTPAEMRRVMETTTMNTDLFDYIERELEPKYKIGMLSNVASNFIERKLTDRQRAMFSAIDLSIETGLVKPDRPAFQHIAERLGAEPAECVFIDDQARYCAAAADLGMQTAVYQSFEQFRHDLTEVLSRS